jgi:hypothetical protein
MDGHPNLQRPRLELSGSLPVLWWPLLQRQSLGRQSSRVPLFSFLVASKVFLHRSPQTSEHLMNLQSQSRLLFNIRNHVYSDEATKTLPDETIPIQIKARLMLNKTSVLKSFRCSYPDLVQERSSSSGSPSWLLLWYYSGLPIFPARRPCSTEVYHLEQQARSTLINPADPKSFVISTTKSWDSLKILSSHIPTRRYDHPAAWSSDVTQNKDKLSFILPTFLFFLDDGCSFSQQRTAKGVTWSKRDRRNPVTIILSPRESLSPSRWSSRTN